MPPVHLAGNSAAEGALLGLAVGDAFGTTLEFTSPPYASFAERVAGPHRDITGGGPFDVVPGQVTDDTAMAICIVRSFLASSGWDASDVAARYVAWSRVTFDIGVQTRETLRRVQSGTPSLEAGLAHWREGGRRAAGNGSLMRTAPNAVLFVDTSDRRRATIEDSLITHADPRCLLACAAFDAAIAAAIREPIDGSWGLSTAGAVVLAAATGVASFLSFLPTWDSTTSFVGRLASSGSDTIFAGSGSATAFQPADDEASRSSSFTTGLCVERREDSRALVEEARLRISCSPESSSRSLLIGGTPVDGSVFVVPVVCMLVSSRRANVRLGRPSK
jgi:hypothetical protein